VKGQTEGQTDIRAAGNADKYSMLCLQDVRSLHKYKREKDKAHPE